MRNPHILCTLVNFLIFFWKSYEVQNLKKKLKEVEIWKGMKNVGFDSLIFKNI